jgi:NAD(P)-dependent dehydrogenase (short-subunit alcohol dehydrogenase family)
VRVVITGANRGIGLALARAYAERGDQVHATARRPTEAGALQELAARAAAGRGSLQVHELDVTREADARRLGEELGDHHVDLLINNAGIVSSYQNLPSLDIEATLEQFNVNALGALRVTRALLENLCAARGKIINVSSTMGSIGDNSSGRAYGYRMSKAALNMATRNLAIELGRQGVTVIALNPGWVQTDMGGAGAPTPVEESAANIVALAEGMQPSDNGKFLHAEGRELPW